MRVNEAARAGEQIPGRQVADGWGKGEGGGGSQDKGSNGKEWCKVTGGRQPGGQAGRA